MGSCLDSRLVVETLIMILFFLLATVVTGQGDIYWGSYELNIPGGSGSGNAVQDLKLPENAPEFFQFAAFSNQPVAAPQFNPIQQQTLGPASRPSTLEVLRPASQPAARPAPQPIRQAVSRPAPQPVVRIAPETVSRPASQPQQLRVFAQQSQRARTAPRRQPIQTLREDPVQIQESGEPAPRFQNFAPRTVQSRPVPQTPRQISVPSQQQEEVNDIVEFDPISEAEIDASTLSRFQLYQLRQKLRKQKEAAKAKEESEAPTNVTEIPDKAQETTAATKKPTPKKLRAGIRRKAVRRRKLTNESA